MNPYANAGSGLTTNEALALIARLTTWHDAMVAHERKLRAGRGEACDDECPHGEARLLWAEALDTFGSRAHELVFLCARATAVNGRPTTAPVAGTKPADASLSAGSASPVSAV